MSSKMRRAPKRRGGQDRKSKPAGPRQRVNESAPAKPLGIDGLVPPSLANSRDNLVMRLLCTAAVGELAVDRLAPQAAQTVPVLRKALGRVYCKAAKAR